MTHDFFGTAGPPAAPSSSHSALRERKWPHRAWFVLGAACVIAVVVAVGWYQRGSEARHLIDSCQRSFIDSRSGFESTEGIEFHGMTVIDYGDDKVVVGVVTGGPPPSDPLTAKAIDGTVAEALQCEVTDGEAQWSSSGYLI